MSNNSRFQKNKLGSIPEKICGESVISHTLVLAISGLVTPFPLLVVVCHEKIQIVKNCHKDSPLFQASNKRYWNIYFTWFTCSIAMHVREIRMPITLSAIIQHTFITRRIFLLEIAPKASNTLGWGIQLV